MFTVLNPLFLALSRAMREDKSGNDAGWGQMLDRREMDGGEMISPVIGAPVYVPPRHVRRDASSN